MSLIKAKISMIHEEYERAVQYFKMYLDEEPSTPLSEDELSWLANAYDHLVHYKLNSIAVLNDSDWCEEDYEKEQISSIIDEIRDELIAICADIIDIVDNNFLQNLKISTREKVYVYKIKGDFLRYMWKANFDKNTYEQASSAYYEALSMCQWNYEPTDVCLLQVAMNYTVHLINANNTDKAINILKQIIHDALEGQNNYDPTNEPLVELFLEYLNQNLVDIQKIADDQKPAQLLEIEADEYISEMIYYEEEQSDFPPDDTISMNLD